MSRKDHYEAVIRESNIILTLLEEKAKHAFTEEDRGRFLATSESYKRRIAEYEQALAGGDLSKPLS